MTETKPDTKSDVKSDTKQHNIVKPNPPKDNPTQEQVAHANDLLTAANQAAAQAAEILDKLKQIVSGKMPPALPEPPEETKEEQELASIDQQLVELQANLKAAHEARPA